MRHAPGTVSGISKKYGGEGNRTPVRRSRPHASTGLVSALSLKDRAAHRRATQSSSPGIVSRAAPGRTAQQAPVYVESRKPRGGVLRIRGRLN